MLTDFPFPPCRKWGWGENKQTDNRDSTFAEGIQSRLQHLHEEAFKTSERLVANCQTLKTIREKALT